MAVADSSWLVGMLNRTDEHHADALALMERAAHVIVTPVAVAEAMFVLAGAMRTGTRAQRRRAAAAAMRSLLATPTVRIRESADLEKALGLVESQPELSFPDALIITAAKAWNEELWTFDGAQRVAHERL